MVDAEGSDTPRHVAIIMDGNGRWARRQGLPRIHGHHQGAKSARAVIEEAARCGVEYLTLYAFSTENWSRPASEVKALMSLLISTLNEYEKALHENGIRLEVIGRTGDLPEEVRARIERCREKTSSNTKMTLVIALSYSSRVEITDAVKDIAEKVKAGDLSAGEITEETIQQHLYTRDIPDPDLLIRTSGEMRVSNFLLWQLSYTEIYVTPCMWPEFGAGEFGKALEDFRKRSRRFGAV